MPFTQYIPGLYSAWSKVSLSYSEESTDQSYYLPSFYEEVEGRGTKKIAEDARLEVVELVLSSKFIQLQNPLSSHREAQTEKVGEQTSSPEKRADQSYNTYLAIFHPLNPGYYSPLGQPSLTISSSATVLISQDPTSVLPAPCSFHEPPSSQVGVTPPPISCGPCCPPHLPGMYRQASA